jgi:hypothetical protein
MYSLQYIKAHGCRVFGIRNLAGCEPDIHNQCVLQKQRAKRMETLLEALTPPDSPKKLMLFRAVQVDIADAYRQITELKHNEGRPYPKVCHTAVSSNPIQYSALQDYLVHTVNAVYESAHTLGSNRPDLACLSVRTCRHMVLRADGTQAALVCSILGYQRVGCRYRPTIKLWLAPQRIGPPACFLLCIFPPLLTRHHGGRADVALSWLFTGGGGCNGGKGAP